MKKSLHAILPNVAISSVEIVTGNAKADGKPYSIPVAVFIQHDNRGVPTNIVETSFDEKLLQVLKEFEGKPERISIVVDFPVEPLGTFGTKFTSSGFRIVEILKK
ncbi:MAG: hypothetical protein WCJ84_06175 [Candidatus Peregrinibacteria bacterium]